MKKSLFFVLFIIGCAVLRAQGIEKPKFLTLNPIIGLDFGNLRLEKSDWGLLGLSDSIYGVEVQNGPGFSLGLMYNFRITNRFSVAPQTIITLQASKINYDLKNQENHLELVNGGTIVIPIHLIYSNIKLGKVNSSILCGGRYSYDTTNYPEGARLNLKKSEYSIDFGGGLTLDCNEVNIRPEFVYSFGLTNLQNGEADIFNSAIKSIKRDRISLRLLLSIKN